MQVWLYTTVSKVRNAVSKVRNAVSKVRNAVSKVRKAVQHEAILHDFYFLTQATA